MALVYRLLNLIFGCIIAVVLCSFRAVSCCIESTCDSTIVVRLTFVIKYLSFRWMLILLILFAIVICEVKLLYHIYPINFVFWSFGWINEFSYIIFSSFSDLLIASLSCGSFVAGYSNLIDDRLIKAFDFIYFVSSRLYVILDQQFSSLNVYFSIINLRPDGKW